MIAAVVAAAALIWFGHARRSLPFRIRRRNAPVEPIAYFEAVASELRRGASLRAALAAPLPHSRLSRLAVTGQPLALVVAELDAAVGGIDDLFVPGVLLAGRTGSPAAALFVQLADRARVAAQMRRLRRTLTAQARLSAAVVGLIPIAIAVLVLASNSFGVITTPGPARHAVILGFAMQCLGLIVIAVLLRVNR